MQVRVLMLVGVGRGTHQQERRKEGGGERQRDQGKKEAATEKSEAAKSALGVGRAQGEFS